MGRDRRVPALKQNVSIRREWHVERDAKGQDGS